MSDRSNQPREPSKEATEFADHLARECVDTFPKGAVVATFSLTLAAHLIDDFTLADRRRVAEAVRMTCCKGVCIWCDMDVPIKLNDEASAPCLYHWIEDEKRFRKCEATNLHAIDLSPIIEGRGA